MNTDSPHSRACGIQRHEHGHDCHSNCPTCAGVPLPAPEVPATNDPKPYGHLHTPACTFDPGSCAEVPADEGTLDEFTPTTEQARDAFIQAWDEDGAGGDFDRWLATELQKARAEAGQLIPMYAMLDIWMALYGSSHPEFDEFYAEHGYAETWARLCSAVREVDSLRAKLTTIHSLLSELDLDGAITRPGTAWGSILREALATPRSQEPPTGETPWNESDGDDSWLT